jgi:dihydropyrimidine dehydrogenase (NAD+) subunit PreT
MLTKRSDPVQRHGARPPPAKDHRMAETFIPSAPAPDIRAGRRDEAAYAVAFGDAVPPLGETQALVAAERCLYCYDAPCAQACPTGIDVPSFIRRIADGNLRGAARTILDANPLGGTCARACPTEVLCEAVCVRVAQEGRSVEIGRLQRHAVEAVMQRPVAALFARAAPTGRRIAVMGAGAAGLACAFILARLGHDVVVHDARPRGGGLNEYGLASYKMAGGFAQAELDWLLGIGGIVLELGWVLDSPRQLEALRSGYDAVYLALGLGATPALGIPGESLAGVCDAIAFIAGLRAAPHPATVPIGRRVVVIGGGMTAVDAAVQSRLLGADEVHMVYRRGPEHLSASRAEQEWAQTNGVAIHHHLRPLAVEGAGGHATAVRFAGPSGEEVFAADMVMKAIGQKLDPRVLAAAGVALEGGRVAADADGRTNLPGVYAGGDCRAGGRDLTVEAVEDGKRAARAIHAGLMSAHAMAASPTSSTAHH